jgi:hypothetical protein
MTSNFGSQEILGEPALLLPKDGEPAEIAEGYVELERVQRLAGRWVIQEYRFAVAAWYELLTHYRRALDGETPPLDNAGDARREILSLGLCSSKATLDASLAGYYSVAMGSVRYMAECWFYSRYLDCHPEKWPAFYRRRSGTPKVKLPDEDGMIKDVIACNHPHAPSQTARRMQKAWIAGSKGAHVTGEGMVQTAGDESNIYHVGPTFSPSMAFTTFAYGLLATERLTRETLCLLRFDVLGAAETANALRDKVEDAVERLESLQPKRDFSS